MSAQGSIIDGISFDKRVFTYASPGVVSTATLYRNNKVVGVVTYTYTGDDVTQEVLTLAVPTS